MSMESHRIGELPIGDIPDIAPKVIAAHISGYLKLHATLLQPLDNPTYALDQNRFQYNVGTILQNLESESFQEVEKVVERMSRACGVSDYRMLTTIKELKKVPPTYIPNGAWNDTKKEG